MKANIICLFLFMGSLSLSASAPSSPRTVDKESLINFTMENRTSNKVMIFIATNQKAKRPVYVKELAECGKENSVCNAFIRQSAASVYIFGLCSNDGLAISLKEPFMRWVSNEDLNQQRKVRCHPGYQYAFTIDDDKLDE